MKQEIILNRYKTGGQAGRCRLDALLFWVIQEGIQWYTIFHSIWESGVWFNVLMPEQT